VRSFRVTVAIMGCLLAAAACSSSSPGVGATGTASSPVTPTAAAAAPAAPVVTAAPASATPASDAPMATPTPAAAASSTQPSAADGIAGAWTGTYTSIAFPGVEGSFKVSFTQAGSRITGTIMVSSRCVDKGTVSGLLSGNAIRFGAVKGTETVTFDGTIGATSMSGTYETGAACGDDKGTWKASRG
jgi:hypothetical protein